jgi:hypothetical protein
MQAFKYKIPQVTLSTTRLRIIHSYYLNREYLVPEDGILYLQAFYLTSLVGLIYTILLTILTKVFNDNEVVFESRFFSLHCFD